MTIDDLAILGGEPAFDEPLHVGRPNIGDRDRFLARVNDALDRRRLTNGGTYVRQFERRIKDQLGVRHCIATCNATVALEIAARALDLSGEVIVPSFTFVATPHSLQWLGLKPVFCDVDPDTHNLDPDRVEELITPRTSAILGVHLWGRPCAPDRFAELAKRYQLNLAFDAAHAYGCSFKGRMIGNFGDLEVFSFHATKFVNSLEGGAIVTNNDELAERARLMANFGFAGLDLVVGLGTNGKMNEVSAAMGLTSLESLNEFVEANRRNYRIFQAELAELPGISLLQFDESEQNNFQYIVLRVDASKSGIERDDLIRILRAENVLARRYFYPGCHNMEPYQSTYPEAAARLPITDRLTGELMVLPTGASMNTNEIRSVCSIVRLCLGEGHDLRLLIESGSDLPVLETTS